MIYAAILLLVVIAIILINQMIIDLKAYNQALRLQARADYYQARVEHSIKTFHRDLK